MAKLKKREKKGLPQENNGVESPKAISKNGLKSEWRIKLDMAWESWLKIVLVLVLFGALIVMLYAKVLPDHVIGIPLVLGFLLLPGIMMIRYYFYNPWHSTVHKIVAIALLLGAMAVAALPISRAIWPADPILDVKMELDDRLPIPPQADLCRGYELLVSGEIIESEGEVSGEYVFRVGRKPSKKIKGEFSRTWEKTKDREKYPEGKKLVVTNEVVHDFVVDLKEDGNIRLKVKDETIVGPIKVLLRKHPVDLYFFLIFCLPLIILAGIWESLERGDLKRSSFSFLVTMIVIFGFLFGDYFYKGGWMGGLMFGLVGGALSGTVIGWSVPTVLRPLFGTAGKEEK